MKSTDIITAFKQNKHYIHYVADALLNLEPIDDVCRCELVEKYLDHFHQVDGTDDFYTSPTDGTHGSRHLTKMQLVFKYTDLMCSDDKAIFYCQMGSDYFKPRALMNDGENVILHQRVLDYIIYKVHKDEPIVNAVGKTLNLKNSFFLHYMNVELSRKNNKHTAKYDDDTHKFVLQQTINHLDIDGEKDLTDMINFYKNEIVNNLVVYDMKHYENAFSLLRNTQQ